MTRIDGDYVFVRTADLLDAGTSLVLDKSQIVPERGSEALRHKGGLVYFA